jgi:hypothetical protein
VGRKFASKHIFQAQLRTCSFNASHLRTGKCTDFYIRSLLAFHATGVRLGCFCDVFLSCRPYELIFLNER